MWAVEVLPPPFRPTYGRCPWPATINLGYTPQMRTLIATLIALMLFATTPVAAGDFEDAMAVYRAGDYQRVVRLLKPLAKQGHARAQYFLGSM